MTQHLFTNTILLIKFILRRERIQLPIWIASISIFCIGVALSFTELYGTSADRTEMAATMKNPAMTAMVGKGYGLDHYTLGAMMAHQMLLFTAIAAGIMSILFVIRHTRADEEAGRMELLHALPLGRLAKLQATMIVAIGMNLVLALMIGIGLYVLQIDSMDINGSLLFGFAVGAAGMIFAGITMVFAQLSENTRTVTSFAFFTLGGAYLIRAMGDVSENGLSWGSPLGWILETQTYVDNRWWPLGIILCSTLILIVLAYYLQSIRDAEAGFIPSFPGRKHASFVLRGPIGLLFRLQRTSLMAWLIGMFIIGASYGSVLGDLESFFEEIDMMQKLLDPDGGFSLTEQFISMLMAVMAMLGTVPVLLTSLKIIQEEKMERTEHMLSRPISRTKFLCSGIIISVCASAVMLFAAGLGLWVTGNAVVDGGLHFGRISEAAIVYLPAVWTMIGLTAMVIGYAPKYTSIVWLYLVYGFVVVYLGGLFNFPDWMAALSPYGHIPQLPVEEMKYGNISILIALTILLLILGFIGYRRRDIGSSI